MALNKYNIKVGDYVETVDGGIGYVTKVFDEGFDWMIVMPRNTSRCTPKNVITSGSFNNKIYKRIGSIDLSEKKNESELIEHFNDINVNESICIKFNELIDRINVIQERLNKCDSEKKILKLER